MSIVNQITARLLLEARLEEEAEEARKAALVAAGPPAGSRITIEAWTRWVRGSWFVCPGRKGDLVCENEACGVAAKCAVRAAKGLHGDGTPMNRKALPKCGARTRAGGTCAMRVVPGKHRCRLHGGLSTGPTPAGRLRLSEHVRGVWAARRAAQSDGAEPTATELEGRL